MVSTGLPEEQQIRKLFDQGEKEQGKKLLLSLIETQAKKRRFVKAEELRDWLIEIDSLALNDIIKAAEIIDNEKASAVDKNYQETWSGLSDLLDSEDFSSLYHILEHRNFAKGEIIAQQGSRQSALYFINNGRVELFYKEKNKEILIKTLGPGDILGSATFFEVSVWTLSARSLGAELSILQVAKLQELKEEHPALESSLNDFCLKFRIPYESIKKLGRDRRTLERKRIQGKTAMSLLDKDRKNTGVGAKGELFDISVGGLSFFLRISQKKNARLLLGRKVRMTLPLSEERSFNVTGTILAVRSQPVVGNEYSVHIRFDKELSPNDLLELLNVGKASEE
jgi:CRP-like cAMP-binding protein